MRKIIKITKQEAIEAWKDVNYEKVRDKDVVVEIEETQTIDRGFYPPFAVGGQTLLTGGITTTCITCKQSISNGVHHCPGYSTYC